MNIIILTLLILSILYQIFQSLKINKFMATQADAAAQLQAAVVELQKANTEIQQKIADLQTAVDNADNVSPDLQAAIDGVVGAAKTLDDVVPDVTP